MVLGGAEQTIKRCKPVIYVENNCKQGSKDLIEFVVRRLGLTCHWHVNPYFSETNFRKNAENIFPESANSINMLCFSGDNPKSVQTAKSFLPSITKIDVDSGKYQLHEYNLSYTGKENSILSQMGTLESCQR